MIASAEAVERQKECDQLNKEIDHYYNAEIIRVGRQIGFNIQNGMDTRDWTNPDDLWKLWIALIKSRGASPDKTTGYKFPARRARLMRIYPEIFGSELGMHQFRMRRIELMDNPLAVAPDAKVFTEAPLHWTDEGFNKSPEYRAYLNEIEVNKNIIVESEVFHPENEAVRAACDPFLNELRKMDLRDIRRAYRRSNEEGNEAFDLLLVDILGIKNPPKISVEKRDPGKTANGEYKSSINTIVIYKRDTPIRDCRGAGVLAHEMWHAYQEMQASYRNGKNHLYKYNNEHYIKSEDDYTGYRTQLVESEAFYFGDAVMGMLRREL